MSYITRNHCGICGEKFVFATSARNCAKTGVAPVLPAGSIITNDRVKDRVKLRKYFVVEGKIGMGRGTHSPKYDMIHVSGFPESGKMHYGPIEVAGFIDKKGLVGELDINPFTTALRIPSFKTIIRLSQIPTGREYRERYDELFKILNDDDEFREAVKSGALVLPSD